MIELLSTKLFIPRPRKNLVARPRLVNRLNQGLDRKLTLIAAPAGFGKTTLLSEWIPQSPRCVTWFSLDRADSDSTRFWTYFIGSLQQLSADLGEAALTLLQSPQAPPITSILTALINDISAFPDDFAIVLDDYHLIDSQVIHEALTFLIAHLPANMHLVMTTRIDPALPLARLRIRDKLTEIRAKELRFTAGEIESFLTQELGEDLTTEEVAILEARTEGWIAGLQIAALSMEGHKDIPGFIRTFSGSHRHLIGYLTDEVLNQRPKGTLNFLLQTSILDRLCGSLCDTVTGESGGQEILESLEHSNLFITPLDHVSKWYRYHHLFTEALQRRLHQVQPKQVPELYRRASNWFERNGLDTESIEYALRGGDWDHAVSLIEAIKEAVQLRGEIFTLLRWLGSLPEEAIQTRPTLGLSHALMLTFVDEFDTAERQLDAAERGLRSNPLPNTDEQNALLGQLAAVREVNALMMEYPGESVLAAGREALRLMPENDLARRGYVFCIMGCAQYLTFGDMQAAERSFQNGLRLVRAAGDLFSELQIQFHLSQMRTIQGRLSAAEEPCEELLLLVSQPGWENIPVAALGKLMKGRILYERNDLLGAQAALTEGIAGIESFSLKRGEITGLVLLSRIKLALGEPANARALIENAWAIIQNYHLKQVMIPAAAYRARLLLQMDDLDTAMQWAATIDLPADEQPDPALEYEFITLARVLLASGQVEACQQLLARLLPPAETAGRMSRVIEILALSSVAAAMHHQQQEALTALHRALLLAEPEGFIRTLVDEGEPMRLLLLDYQTMFKKEIGDRMDSETLRLLTYTEKLLAGFSQPAPVENSKPGTIFEPLSEREQDILQLIATGRSNKEIAVILVIAVSTVKSHINHIYGKLGAKNRVQAITLARNGGLLS